MVKLSDTAQITSFVRECKDARSYLFILIFSKVNRGVWDFIDTLNVFSGSQPFLIVAVSIYLLKNIIKKPLFGVIITNNVSLVHIRSLY